MSKEFRTPLKVVDGSQGLGKMLRSDANGLGSWSFDGSSLTGVAAVTAATLATARTINGVSFNGSANINVPSIYDANYRRITNPGGAEYVTTSSSITGAIAITLPVGMTNTMVRLTVKVFEYAGGESFEIHCGGYSYSTGNRWVNAFAYIVGHPLYNRSFSVRFGYTAGGKAIIYIGELADTWSYPQVYVTEVQLGFGGQSSTWVSGWSIGFVTSAFENVTVTVANAQVGQLSTTNPVVAGTAAVGTSTTVARSDHVHPAQTTVSGNAGSATYASAVTLTADNSTNATNYPLFVNAATGNLSPRTDTGFTYNPSTGALLATSFNAITALSSTTPVVAGTGAVGSSTTVARADHVHPAQETTAYGVQGAYTLSDTSVKSGYWVPLGEVTMLYNATYFNGTSISVNLRLKELTNTGSTIMNTLLEDFEIRLKVALPAAVAGANFSAAVPDVLLELAGFTRYTHLDIAVRETANSTSSKTIRVYLKLRAQNSHYLVLPSNRYGASYDTNNNISSAYCYFTTLPSAAAITTLPTDVQAMSYMKRNMVTREKLTADTSIYVNTSTGSDAGYSGRHSGIPLATIQAAIDMVCNTLDLGPYNVVISVANGTYNEALTLKSYVTGGGKVTIRGSGGSPGTVTIQGGASNALYGVNCGTWGVDILTLASTSGSCIGVSGGRTTIEVGDVAFGNAGAFHMFAGGYAVITCGNGYTANSNAVAHWAAIDGAIILVGSGLTVNIQGAFSGSTAYASTLGTIKLDGVTLTGTSTGTRYYAALNSVISVNGAGANFIPGNSAGATATGGQYA